MNTDTTFNGWTNRETWCAVMHIDSTEWMQDYALAVAVLCDDIEEWITGVAEMIFYPAPNDPPVPDEMRIMIGDIGSLWRVDWQEIERHYIALAREIDDHQQED